MRLRILYIQRQHTQLSSTLRRLEKIGYAAMGVQSVTTALELMQIALPDCILLGLNCPQSDLQRFLADYPTRQNIPLVAIKDTGDSQSFMNERKYGTYFHSIINPAEHNALKAFFAKFNANRH